MKERPILFSGEMVKAILEGQKTQTRRVIKPQPWRTEHGDWAYAKSERSIYAADQWMSEKGMRGQLHFHCPYGPTGDRLWVRETWATPGNYDHIKPSELAASHFSSSELVYRATEQCGDVYCEWRPSIFMPRWASRITLEITGVRVERVQEITSDDALAEGIDREKAESTANWNDYGTGSLYVDQFAALWDSINTKRGYDWDSNPWVWVVEFKVAQ